MDPRPKSAPERGPRKRRTDQLQGINLFPEINVRAIPEFEGGTSRKNVRCKKTSPEDPIVATIPEVMENLGLRVVQASCGRGKNAS